MPGFHGTSILMVAILPPLSVLAAQEKPSNASPKMHQLVMMNCSDSSRYSSLWCLEKKNKGHRDYTYSPYDLCAEGCMLSVKSAKEKDECKTACVQKWGDRH